MYSVPHEVVDVSVHRDVLFVDSGLEAQTVAAHEPRLNLAKADNVIRTIQRKIEGLDGIIGPVRRAHVISRLSNAGSSNAGAVFSNRIDAYKRQVPWLRCI